MPNIISVIDINLRQPLCEHRPRVDSSPWGWEIIPTMTNSVPTYGLRIFCTICGAEDSIPVLQLVAAFNVRGKPAEEGRRPLASVREFTALDRKFLKSCRISVDDTTED